MWPQVWTKVSSGTFDVKMLSVSNTVLNALSGAGIAGTLSSPTQRLGLALTVSNTGTTGDALDVMYDHPTFDSRFEFDTGRAPASSPALSPGRNAADEG